MELWLREGPPEESQQFGVFGPVGAVISARRLSVSVDFAVPEGTSNSKLMFPSGR